MKILNALSGFGLGVTLLGCGGIVDIEQSSSSSDGAGGSDVATSSSSTAGSGGATASSSTSSATTGSGGQGGMLVDPLLTVALFNDSNDSHTFVCQIDPYEYIGSTVLIFSQTVGAHPLEIGKERFMLESTDGGYVVGSAGTPYFNSIKLEGPNHVTVMGPMEIDAPPASTFAELVMTDPFDQSAGDNTTYAFTVRLDGCAEDAPGEFLGRNYRVVKEQFHAGDVIDQSNGQPVSLALIVPSSDLAGHEFMVIQQ